MTQHLSGNQARAERQLAVVCRACQVVHHITTETLRGTHVTCPTCGVARSTSAVINALPPGFLRAPQRPRGPVFSEFPTRG